MAIPNSTRSMLERTGYVFLPAPFDDVAVYVYAKSDTVAGYWVIGTPADLMACGAADASVFEPKTHRNSRKRPWLDAMGNRYSIEFTGERWRINREVTSLERLKRLPGVPSDFEFKDPLEGFVKLGPLPTAAPQAPAKKATVLRLVVSNAAPKAPAPAETPLAPSTTPVVAAGPDINEMSIRLLEARAIIDCLYSATLNEEQAKDFYDAAGQSINDLLYSAMQRLDDVKKAMDG